MSWRPAARTLAIFFVATAVASVPLWLLQPRGPEAAAAVPLSSLAPLIGAVAVLIWRGRGNPVRLGWGGRPDGRSVRRVLLAAAAAFGILLGLVQLRTFLAWDLMPLDMIALPLPLAVVAAIMLPAVFAQELGWRGIVAPALAPFGELRAAAGTGLAWAAWAAPGLAEIGPAQLALLAVSTIALSLVIARLQRGLRGGRFAVAVAFRWVLAAGLLVFGDEEAGNVPALGLLALMSVIAAGAAVLAPRVRYSFSSAPGL